MLKLTVLMENQTNAPMETPSKPYALGIKFGLLAGVVYVLLLLIRYRFLASDPRLFSGSIMLSYLLILGLFAVAGLARRRSLGGFAETREIFGTIFIVILIAEVFYLVFNYVYLNYIDPDFFRTYTDTVIGYLERSGTDLSRINDQMSSLEAQNEQKRSLMDNLRLFATSVVIDGVFGLIIALVIRRARPRY